MTTIAFTGPADGVLAGCADAQAAIDSVHGTSVVIETGGVSMFERYTDRARRVVVLAQEHARLLNHSYIGTEHLVLGLLHEGEGVAAQALKASGLDLEKLRARVIEIAEPGEQPSHGHIPFTVSAKKALEFTLREALQLGSRFIGTEHLLLGLIRDGGTGAEALAAAGVATDGLRLHVLETLRRQLTSDVAKPARYAPRPGPDVVEAWEITNDNVEVLAAHLGITVTKTWTHRRCGVLGLELEAADGGIEREEVGGYVLRDSDGDLSLLCQASFVLRYMSTIPQG